MHFLVLLILHAIVYGVVFHLIRHLTLPELVGFGIFAIVVLIVWSRSPLRRRTSDRIW